MEPWQRDIIKRNLPELVELTKWSPEISATLTSKSILSPGDLDSLDTCYRSEGAMVCAQRLYSILETRTAGFEGVASALHKARQTGAFNILLKECVCHLAEQRTFLLPCSPISPTSMLPRNLVSSEIFDYCVADLLVFKGIGFDELCSFTKCGQRASLSGDLDANDYVLPQGEIDFSEICKKAAKRNVHLLEYKRDSGGFLLVQSFGHVFNISQFLQGNEYESIGIHNYFSTITSDSEVRLIECDFQMWISFIVEFEKKNKNSAFGCLGWNGSEIEKVDLAHKDSVIGKTSKELLQALLSCENYKAQEILSRCIVEECHLILRVVGRVENERLKLVKEIIHKVCSEIGNMRVWMLVHAEVWRLERVFRVKGWRLKGPEKSFKLLPDANVISPALQRELKWLCPILPTETPYFSSPPVVNLLKAKNVGQGENVAEIYGEIFAHFTNILTLWLGAQASSDIQLELMKIGLRSLFPGNVDLIHGGGMHSRGQISFVCEDIAAFAVAKLLAEDRYSKHIETMKLEDFVTNELFQLNEMRVFENLHVWYFLDYFLSQKSGSESWILQIIKKMNDRSTDNAQSIVLISIIGSFPNLLKHFAEESAKGPQSELLKDNDLMRVVVAFGNVPILNHMFQINPCNIDLLRLAMKRGDISIVNNILGRKSYNFEMKDYSVLLSSCVENSYLDTEPIIIQKKKVIDQLLEEMRSKYKGSWYISYKRIHVQLFKHLIAVGVLDIDNSISIIAQNALSHFTPEEFHDLVLYLTSTVKMNFFETIDDNGWTALHHILIHLQILPESLDNLRVHQVDFNNIANDDLSLLSCAILGNQSATVVKKLVDCGANRNFKNKYGNGLLHLAAYHGNLSAMLVLLEAGGRGCSMQEVSERNVFGYAPIHLTFIGESKENFIESINLLLRCGADVDCTDASGSTPLFWAVTKCKKDEWLDAVSFLVKRGANLQATDNDGRSMVHRAASERSPKQYHELIQRIIGNLDGCGLKEKCYFQCTPLHYAVLHLELMEATLDLLLKYMDINDIDRQGNNVLMYAIRGGRDSRFLKMLLEKGAEWSINNYQRFSALHQAAKYGNVDALQLFIEKGCDVNNVTVDAETPLHVAFQHDHDKVKDIVSILVKNKADVSTKDTKGRTPFELAEARHDYGAAKKMAMEELKNHKAEPKTMDFLKSPHVRFPLSLLPNHGE